MNVNELTLAQFEKETQKRVRKCIAVLSKKEYDLNLYRKIVADTAVEVLHVYSRQNGRSRAGRFRLSICKTSWQFGAKTYEEYDSFDKDPTIGRIKVTDDSDTLWLIVAHEVSHFVQYSYWYKADRRLQRLDDRPHGARFKYAYRILRRDLVNPLIRERRSVCPHCAQNRELLTMDEMEAIAVAERQS